MKYWAVFFLSSFSAAAVALDFDFGMYMRAPVGANSHGGKQIQLRNPGSQGNEFRLGNEGGYGEALFTGHVLKGKTADAPYFFANITMAYMADMNAQYGDSSANGDPVHLIQSYAKGGNFDGIRASFWAGKRHYRDVDIYINDFYYFANMGGVGGGVEDVRLGPGTLAVALLQSADENFQDTTTGLPVKQVLDIRWFNVAIGEKDRLHFWLAAGYTPAGSGEKLNSGGTYDPVEFETGLGGIAGLRWGHDLAGGHNDLALMYGTGVIEDFSMNRNFAFTSTGVDVNGSRRWRLVESLFREVNPRMGIQTAIIYDHAISGMNVSSRWLSVAARPVFYITDHYHLAFEGGFSSVLIDSETDGAGGGAEERTLGRVTIAPEMAMGKGYFDRPLVRAYLTHTWWNGANANLNNTSSLLGGFNASGFTALNDTRSETQVGVQCEVWF